jgi:hypothetical protein
MGCATGGVEVAADPPAEDVAIRIAYAQGARDAVRCWGDVVPVDENGDKKREAPPFGMFLQCVNQRIEAVLGAEGGG